MVPIYPRSRRHIRALLYILGIAVVIMGYLQLSFIVSKVPSTALNIMTDAAVTSQNQASAKDLFSKVSSRASRTQSACKTIKSDILTRQFQSEHEKHLIVDDKTKIMFCYVPKVACTNFKRIFLGLAGVVQPAEVDNISGYDVHFTYVNHLKFLQDYNKEERIRKMNEYKKFMFIRDPLERLVSAFRSKFEIHPNPNSRAVFLQRIEAFYQEFPRRAQKRKILKTLSTGAIAFKDFLYYILDHRELNGQVNEHFVPIVDLCNPCEVHYDYIGSYERLQEEASLIFKELSLKYHFPAKNDNYSSVETKYITKAYYRELPSELIHSVWKIFKNDYIIFDIPIPTWILKYTIKPKADVNLKNYKMINHTHT